MRLYACEGGACVTQRRTMERGIRLNHNRRARGLGRFAHSSPAAGTVT